MSENQKTKGKASMEIMKVIKAFKKKTVWIPAVAVLVLIVSVIVYFSIPKEPTVTDTKYLVGIITQSSELTTVKLHFTGKAEYKDSGVAFINKSDFIMMYEADASVGVNLEEVKVTADDYNKIIHVEIPAAQVLDIHIDPATIEYFDEKFSLFNFDKKEDGDKAQAMAEEQALEELKEMGVITLADTQAATLIKGLLANAIPDGYTIEIKK